MRPNLGIAARFAIGLALLAGCAPAEGEPPGTKASAIAAAAPTTGGPGDVDILFVIDDSSSMAPMQAKLVAQLPSFVTALESLPGGLPNVHIAVVSSDLGAPGDSTAQLGCTTAGDQGVFQTAPRGGCSATTLAAGATYISNVGRVANYTGDLGSVLSCIVPLGTAGCSFQHQLGAAARALGADGAAMPCPNAGFLRPNAELAIIVLSNEDDCSAPYPTVLYSILSGYGDNLKNSLGPLTAYRCNEFGHLCHDPTSSNASEWIPPPEMAPTDAQGSPPTLNLVQCESNESDGLLTTLRTLTVGLGGLKSNAEARIIVGAIVAPVGPYAVAWKPQATGQPAPGELWPHLEHSCGPTGSDLNPAGQVTTDGSFGDPSVRLTQFVEEFGANGVVTSICNDDYGAALSAIAARIGANLQAPNDGGVSGDGACSVATGATGGGVDGAVATGAGGGGVGGAGTTGVGGGAGTGGSAGNGGRGPGTGHAGTGGHPDGLQDGCTCGLESGRPGALGAAVAFLLMLSAVGRRRRSTMRAPWTRERGLRASSRSRR